MKKIDVLFLSLSDILGMNLSFEDTEKVVREALVEHGRKSVLMPPKFGVHPGIGSHCNAMPAFIPKMKALGIKWVSGFPGNRERSLPYITGTLIINDDMTGVPLGIMEASWITAMRTATVTGLVARHFSREGARMLGIVGTGVQGRFNLRAIVHAVPGLHEIRAFDIDQDVLADYVRTMQESVTAKVIAVNSAKDALSEADIMVTATSFVERPYVRKEWLRAGDLGILVHHRGWDNEAFYLADKFVVDDWTQTKSYGMEDGGFYGDIPDCYAELGEVLAGLKPGRERKEERVVVVTCGLAILDVAMGKMIYEKAVTRGIGTYLPFINSQF
jgi:ornithine cyclodeaminase/alanine dehydrogenase-like protein (mu-crystallin family)